MMDAHRLTRRSFLGGGLALAGATLLPAGTARAAVADLDFASALEAARAIRRGDVSSVELTTRMLDRIALHNKHLNAIATLAADGALARARAADEARARGEWWGPFHGVPCTVKDTFEVTGVATTAGSATLKNHIPERDAVVVLRLRRAGAVVLGKTNVPLWASDWQSYNEVFGASNNPWNLARTPGGSTGGGAAAPPAGPRHASGRLSHRLRPRRPRLPRVFGRGRGAGADDRGAAAGRCEARGGLAQGRVAGPAVRHLSLPPQLRVRVQPARRSGRRDAPARRKPGRLVRGQAGPGVDGAVQALLGRRQPAQRGPCRLAGVLPHPRRLPLADGFRGRLSTRPQPEDLRPPVDNPGGPAPVPRPALLDLLRHPHGPPGDDRAHQPHARRA